MGGSVGNVVHWLLFFFVVGGLAMLFLSRPQQTNDLVKTITGGISDVSSAMKTYVSGAAPA